MYERSAIVLERYFEDTIGYSKECNIKDNFDHYCNIVEKLEKYQINYQKELIATQDCNNALKKIKAIQIEEEKLYKQSANLEYNRNILFNNIDNKSEDTRKCIEKIESSVEENNKALVELKDKFIEALEDYENKKFELSKCKRYKKMAENDYNEILDISVKNFEGIDEEDIDTAKAFTKFQNYEEIIDILIENGSKEKIPFNEGVMECATKFGVEIAKNEAATYVSVYEKMTRLLTDIENGAAKIELHKKYVRNEKAKIDFIMAVKEYIVQFFDYERMTIIHGTKSHNRLMNEACENFNNDIIQINNLYELLLKEISKKATKKAYKELYNKSYLIEIKQKEEKFKKEKNKVNLNTATLINSNYWRIEGIRSIYTIFYKNVSEVFGRDVVEFDIPKEFNLDDQDDSNNEETAGSVEDSDDNDDIVQIKSKVKSKLKLKSKEQDDDEDDNEEPEEKKQKIVAKIPFEISVDLQDNIEDEIEELEEIRENIRSKKLSRKVFNLDDEEDEINDEEQEEVKEKSSKKSVSNKSKTKIKSKKVEIEEDEEDFDDDEMDEEFEDDKYEEDEDENNEQYDLEDEIDSLEDEEDDDFDDDEDEEDNEEDDFDYYDEDEDEDDDENEEDDESEEDELDIVDNNSSKSSITEEFDIFGEKYQDIDFLENSVLKNSRKNENSSAKESKKSNKSKIKYTATRGTARKNLM